MIRKELTTIGRTAAASFPADEIVDVPVKIDTGADRSSIWASNLNLDEKNVLHFTLFDTGSPYYSGKVHKAAHYTAILIRSSNGTAQVRYRVELAIRLGGRRIRGTFTLADRSRNTYPVLIGCALLRNKFIVDVTQESSIQPPPKPMDHTAFDEELRKDPQAFFNKYYKHNGRGDVEL